MLPFSWFRKATTTRAANPVRVTHHRPELEALERRELLAIFTVNSIGDQADPTPGDGVADDVDAGTAGVQITLRSAIQSANSAVGLDTIAFNIGGGGVQTIAPTSALPDITDAVHIDGTTQPGFVGSPLIELNGSNAGTGVTGLRIRSTGTTIEALVINRFGQFGIWISGSGSSGNVVLGNYIGTDVHGTAALGNSDNGVLISDGASSNTLGGTALGARNLISGNNSYGVDIRNPGSSGNVVLGNYIGTDVNGTADLGNNGNGVLILAGASSNTIGGTATGARNLISRNIGVGVEINGSGSSGNMVLGNTIGTDVHGTANLGNVREGVSISGGASSNTLGGTASGARNLISGNNSYGVEIFGTGSSGNVVLGNYIGTDVNGTADLGNSFDGVFIFNGASNTLGGTASGARNLISGNNSDGVEIFGTGSSGNVVLGNYIGTDVHGTADLGNSLDGVLIFLSSNNTIGGTSTGARNLISGNDSEGITFSSNSSGNVVLGNYIGTDVHGTADLGNSLDGVLIFLSSNNTIGGTSTGARNLISGNDSEGITFSSNSSGNVVLGNYIGTDVHGTADLGNSLDGVLIFLSSNNTIGGTSTGARNLISGNDSEGITFSSNSSGNVVLGNYIGTDINGTTGLGNTTGGLVTSGDLNTIGGTVTGARNLISGNSDHGVEIKDSSSGNVVLGNYIGTDVNGTADLGNSENGVLISGGASSNTLGGTASGARNLISGNDRHGVEINRPGSSGNVVLGNYIGTDVNGTADLGNSDNGVFISDGASSNTLGGTASGARNLISGNTRDGVQIIDTGSSGNVVLGNYIGTDINGTADLGNNFNGVSIFSGASSNMVGGSVAGARNLISGNNFDGVDIGSSGNVVLGNYIGTDINGTADLGNSNGVVISVGASNTVGGAAAGARNLISGNNFNGVDIRNPGSSGNVVLGNYIGTDVNGTADLGNALNGVQIGTASANTVGGSVAGARNLISGNDRHGVEIDGTGSSGNVVLGNTIGTDVHGTTDLGNSLDGVLIFLSSNNTIGGTSTGARNLISGNDSEGITFSSNSSGNVVLGNYIGTDINGTTDLGNTTGGLVTSGDSNTIGGTVTGARNLISGNSDHGVEIKDGSSGNVLLGNYIGTDVHGTADLGNTAIGVLIINGASSNMIGGTATGAGNLISGNDRHGVEINSPGSSGNVVLGNYIGTDVNGTADLGNSTIGVLIINGASSNMIGGTATGAGNLISGNDRHGVEINSPGSSGNVVLGNYIGTDVNGTADLGNSENGVLLFGASNNTIGGTATGSRNLISGNNSDGVDIRNASSSGNVVLGNYIGTDTSGIAGFGNTGSGVLIVDASANVVGGSVAGARNLISGNTLDGVQILGTGSSGNVVLGNFIGTDVHGTTDLGNAQDGVLILNGASTNTVGGTTSGARNVISGNIDDGVEIRNPGSNGNVVLGNYIGTDVHGTADLGNARTGVVIGGASRNTIGGTTPGARNLISGNGFDGVRIEGSGSSGNVVLGNSIGTDVRGTIDLGNSFDGVLIDGGASSNTVGGTATGAGNTIAFNGAVGVAVGTNLADNSIDNSILGNSIFDNAALGIDLGSDGPTPNDPLDVDASPNRLQNFPDLTRAERVPGDTVVEGTLNSTPGRTFRIEFFSSVTADPSGFGQGQTFLDSLEVTTDGTTADVSFSTLLGVVLPVGTPITATATDLTTGDTSEFSQFEAVVLEPPTVTINQALGQADPTNQNPIVFTVVFSETVTGFGPDDITFTGSTVGGTLSASITESDPLDGTTFSVEVNGATGVGNVVASVVAGAAQDATGNPSNASTSTDNTVLFDDISPTVTIEATDDPIDGFVSRTFTVTFSEPVFGFTSGDVGLGGTAGATTATVSGSGAVYTVTVTGMTQTGSITLTIPNAAAVDAAGNANTNATLTVRFGAFLVTGAGEGGGPHVVVRDVVNDTVKFNFFAYVDGFTGGVRVATGDINGDGTLDIITAAGPGGGSHVRIFDGNDLSVINEFFAYVNGFTGGVFVASGDVNGDGFDDVITGAGAGGTTHVRVFGGGGTGTLAEFFAYDPAFTGGVQVAVGDIDGDGRADIVTGAGPGGTPLVKVVDALSANLRDESGQIQDAALLTQFFAYDAAFAGGVFVASGDVTGDGLADILTGAGPSGGPHVKLIDATRVDQLEADGVLSDAALLANFFAYEPPFGPPELVLDPPYMEGVRVGIEELETDGTAAIVTAPGSDAILPVRVRDLPTLAESDSFFAFEDFGGGVFVS